MTTTKLDPHVMMPVRRAHVDVIGRLWQGGEGSYRYYFLDKDLEQIYNLNDDMEPILSRDAVDAWLARNAGDFASIH